MNMLKRKLVAWMLLALSLGAIAALAGWNYVQARRFVFERHTVWVDRLVSQINEVRNARLAEVRGWTLRENPNLEAMARQDDSTAALFYDDTEMHHERRWKRADAPAAWTTPDPRLVALEL